MNNTHKVVSIVHSLEMHHHLSQVLVKMMLMEVILHYILPYYDMTDYNDPAFTYWRWYTNNTGAEPNADWWQVKITEDGINWIKVENNLTSDISWRRFAFRAKDYVDLTSTSVQLKFVASDSAYGALSSGSLVEAAVDDLYLWDSNSSVSVEDINYKPNTQLLRITDILGERLLTPKYINIAFCYIFIQIWFC